MAELARAPAGNGKDKLDGERCSEALPASIAQAAPVQLQCEENHSATLADDLDETVDWDVHIETPPPRPSQTLTVRFVQGDYRRPKISDDPQD